MALRGFTFGPYELLARLPSSAPTQTFLSRQRGADSFKKLVCLRTLLPAHAKDDAVVETFLAEARLAAHLNHPTCVTIYDLGRERGAYFISMEYVTGETLTSLIDSAAARREPIPAALVASIIASVCDGLHSAHELREPSGRSVNLVHGDLSPRNLMITYEGHAKILDFGVASTKTEHRGRVRYASPERLQGKAVDRRSDLYSLGLIMFEMLAARALGPTSAEERTDWVLGAARAPKLSLLVPDVHPRLAAIVEKALAPAREARFGTAEELAEALRAHLLEIGFSERRTAIVELMRAHFDERAQIRTRTVQKLLRGDCNETELETALGARSVAEIELLFGPANDTDETALPRSSTKARLGAALRMPIAAAIPIGIPIAEAAQLPDERTDEVPQLPPGAADALDGWAGPLESDTIGDGLQRDATDGLNAPTAIDGVRALGAALPEQEIDDNPTSPRASLFDDELTADAALRAMVRQGVSQLPPQVTIPPDQTTAERMAPKLALPLVVEAPGGEKEAEATHDERARKPSGASTAEVPRGGSHAPRTPAPKLKEQVSAPAHTPLPQPELADDEDVAAVIRRDTTAPMPASGRLPGYVTKTAAIKMLLIGIGLGMVAGVLIAVFVLAKR